MKEEIYTVAVPTWAMGYIFNSDLSGLSADEVDECDKFLSELRHISPPDSEPYFDAFPPFGLPCEVADCQVIYK